MGLQQLSGVSDDLKRGSSSAVIKMVLFLLSMISSRGCAPLEEAKVFVKSRSTFILLKRVKVSALKCGRFTSGLLSKKGSV